ncbi:hypothetical protein HOG17_03495 [Candidatus Peregrinibacteria bacterium]|jgi:hypothetical protein|nr:hypothetical protein [Candidatus Peregrinibacteria bacterium]MBT4148269.1 hypothetical protein [Candidatus Peregrinibacteria bacterium]MBT4366559.1 hypothetical protein [Candidatus Peregrinibacteria bacterium]MBT4455962.1 hypothetical protein [Candidatus Peregrinibacteria bacterium]
MKQNTPKSPEKDQSNSNSSNSEIRKENLNDLPKQPFESTASKTAEYVDLGESAEVQGEVSEGIREQSEQKGDGVKGSRKKDDRATQMTAAQIKAQLLKSAPSEKVMLRQVKKEIEKEVRYLNKRARKILRKPGSVSAFEVNNVVKKIRELKALLVALSKATADAAKTLWLRFVHGVM